MGLPAVVVMKNPNERLAFSVSVRRGEQRWAGHAAVIAILTETSQAAPLRITAFLPLTAGERISPLPVCTKKEPA